MSKFGLSKSEFESELQRRFGWKPNASPIKDQMDSLTSADVRDLLPSYLSAHTSPQNPRRDHPLLQRVLSDRLSLLELKTRAAMTSSDFGLAMGDALSSLLYTRFDPFITEINTLCRTINVRDFRPVGTATLTAAEPEEVVEDTELKTMPTAITEGTRKGQLRSFGGRMNFSRTVMESWPNTITDAVMSFAAVFGQLEARVMAETIEASTPTSVSGGLTTAGLDNANKALRNALNAAGQKSGLGIYALLVPPHKEMEARLLRCAMAWSDLRIVTNTHLTSDTTVYAFANPALSAPLLRFQLRGGGRPTVAVNMNESFIQTKFALSHDFDYVMTPDVPGVIKVTS